MDKESKINRVLIPIDFFKYMGAASTEGHSLYRCLKQLYVKLNTGLPASAAVQRLFYLGGRVLTPLRNRLSAEHFKMMVFLRLAKW